MFSIRRSFLFDIEFDFHITISLKFLKEEYVQYISTQFILVHKSFVLFREYDYVNLNSVWNWTLIVEPEINLFDKLRTTRRWLGRRYSHYTNTERKSGPRTYHRFDGIVLPQTLNERSGNGDGIGTIEIGTKKIFSDLIRIIKKTRVGILVSCIW